MAYTKKQIIEKLETGIKDMSTLYNKHSEKHEGYISAIKKTKENVFYSDVIAEYLIKHIDLFNNENIPEIKRDKPYRERNKITDEERRLVYRKKQGEEWVAKSLLGYEYEKIGTIKYFQYPIYNTQKKNGVGDIDLIAFDEKSKLLSLIEIKREYNKESILKAILEITTYFFQVDKNNLKKNFPHSNIQKVVLIYKDSLQHKQYKESGAIRELAEKLQVNVFVLDYKIISL